MARVQEHHLACCWGRKNDRCMDGDKGKYDNMQRHQLERSQGGAARRWQPTSVRGWGRLIRHPRTLAQKPAGGLAVQGRAHPIQVVGAHRMVNATQVMPRSAVSCRWRAQRVHINLYSNYSDQSRLSAPAAFSTSGRHPQPSPRGISYFVGSSGRARTSCLSWAISCVSRSM